jgi:hypothetical protein
MKLLLASDLHYVPNLADEIATNLSRLPADTYDHQVEGKLYWHNEMLVEAGEELLDALEGHVLQEQPDLLIVLGDVVNINWEKSIAAAAARLKRFPCPLRLVTGNHDIYLQGAENRVQDALMPGSYETGLRYEIVSKGTRDDATGGELGLIYLDLFSLGEQGDYRKWSDPDAAEPVAYRPQDMAAAMSLMASTPETPWLIIGHFPFVSPDDRIIQAGRKVGRLWPSAAPLAAHLMQPNNLLGMICGHQHFAHFQPFTHGFHWTLPAMVEYPCAAAVVEWDGAALQGRIIPLDERLAAASLRVRQEHWTAGEAMDRHFVWPLCA